MFPHSRQVAKIAVVKKEPSGLFPKECFFFVTSWVRFEVMRRKRCSSILSPTPDKFKSEIFVFVWKRFRARSSGMHWKWIRRCKHRSEVDVRSDMKGKFRETIETSESKKKKKSVTINYWIEKKLKRKEDFSFYLQVARSTSETVHLHERKNVIRRK